MTAAAPPVKVVGARLRKLSRYGMTIESPFALERGSVLRLRMEVLGQKADVEARVIACGPAGEGKGFDVGLEFTALPRTVRSALAGTPPQHH